MTSDQATVLRAEALRRHAALELDLARAAAADAREHAWEAQAALLRARELEVGDGR